MYQHNKAYFFLGLFIYRQATYATYTTLSSTKFEQKIENKDSFILVAGDSSDNTMKSFQEVMTTYQTKNRKNKLYYVDTKGKSSDYLVLLEQLCYIFYLWLITLN